MSWINGIREKVIREMQQYFDPEETITIHGSGYVIYKGKVSCVKIDLNRISAEDYREVAKTAATAIKTEMNSV